jgi:hypothetical protein
MHRDLLFGGKLTASETNAVETAMRKYRGRTMEAITKADIARAGAAAFCAQEGVKWPVADNSTSKRTRG